MEIIVADGMSEDGTREKLFQLAQQDPRIKVLDNPERIVSTGLNIALEASKGKIICRMDVHAEYAPDYIKQCVWILEQTGADNVGGPARTKYQHYLQQAICAAYHSPFSVGGASFHNPEYEGYVDTVTYGCWPRDVFNRIGQFDEGLVRNQDDELNLRLIRSGGKIWQSPAIKSWYFPRGTLSKLFKQYQQYGYWKVRVIQKHKIPASVRHLIPGGFVLCLLGLPLVALWWDVAGWLWMGLIGVYVVATVCASFYTAKQKGWMLVPVLPLVFACFHIGYGWGFLSGILDFVILKRGSRGKYETLSRTTEKRCPD